MVEAKDYLQSDICDAGFPEGALARGYFTDSIIWPRGVIDDRLIILVLLYCST